MWLMSAIGTKRTCRVALRMSAFAGKADITYQSIDCEPLAVNSTRWKQERRLTEVLYRQERNMTNEQKNMELMQTLDDAWNAQDWDTFDKRHKPDVIVRWPAQPPTHGRHDHRAEGVQMFKTFPDNRVHNRPYRVFFASGDWTCSIARFTGTMKGPMMGPDGKEIPPTLKSFEVDFCTVARWGKRRDRRRKPVLRCRRPHAPDRGRRL